MHPKDVVLQTLDSSENFVNTYVGDLSDADLLVRAAPGMNHLAWQIGHLLVSERHILEELAPGTSPPLPDDFAAKHSKEARVSDDPNQFATKAQYLELSKAQRAATKQVLAGLTDEQLDAPAPISIQRFVPTVGLTFNFIGLHTLMHVGQFVAVRRLLDKPITI